MEPIPDPQPPVPSLPVARFAPPVCGRGFAWAETGTEGLVWAVIEPEREGYEGLHVISAGDLVKITALDGRVVFEGEIEADSQVCWTPHWEGAQHGQPCVDGYWVHWIQRGWDPPAWVRIFTEEQCSIELRKRILA